MPPRVFGLLGPKTLRGQKYAIISINMFRRLAAKKPNKVSYYGAIFLSKFNLLHMTFVFQIQYSFYSTLAIVFQLQHPFYLTLAVVS